MAAKVRLKINRAGVRQLLQSAEVQEDLRTRANRVKAAAGPGFEARVDVVGKSNKLGRAMGYVTTSDARGRKKQAKKPVLQRALNAGK